MFVSDNRPEPAPQHTPSNRRVGGLSNRAFWALIVLAVVIIIAAGVGGGIGGGLSRQNKVGPTTQEQPSTTTSFASVSTNVSASPSSTRGFSTTTAILGTTTSSAQLSLTQEIGPTETLFRDCPSSNDTIYSASFGTTDYEFRKLCGLTIVNSVPDTNAVNQAASSLNDCIDMCAAWNANNATAGSGNLICQTVCWRWGVVDDDHPGSCFGFETTNSSTGIEVAVGPTNCDSAVWINQS